MGREKTEEHLPNFNHSKSPDTEQELDNHRHGEQAQHEIEQGNKGGRNHGLDGQEHSEGSVKGRGDDD